MSNYFKFKVILIPIKNQVFLPLSPFEKYSHIITLSYTLWEVLLMHYLTVIATIKAKPDQVDFVKSELCKLVRPTTRERGCLQYGFYQDTTDPTLFHSYETWVNKAALDKHLLSKHILAYEAATVDAVTRFKIATLYKIC